MNPIFISLKNTLDSYCVLSDTTWNALKQICTIQTVKKNEYAFDLYDKVDAISFVYEGLFRSFATNEKAEEYTKNFFWETRFFGPIVSMLTHTPITACVQALEDATIVNIQYSKYRELLYKYEDLKLFHILYLEKHWVIQKDENAYSMALENALDRYQRFLQEYGHIVNRVSQYHIASYLGITPTHLSRIKKELKHNCAK
jgi:CRP-like cAMP-binding protein